MVLTSSTVPLPIAILIQTLCAKPSAKPYHLPITSEQRRARHINQSPAPNSLPLTRAYWLMLASILIISSDLPTYFSFTRQSTITASQFKPSDHKQFISTQLCSRHFYEQSNLCCRSIFKSSAIDAGPVTSVSRPILVSTAYTIVWNHPVISQFLFQNPFSSSVIVRFFLTIRSLHFLQAIVQYSFVNHF